MPRALASAPTILELDMSMAEFGVLRASLTQPDALDRFAEIVAATHLRGLHEEMFALGSR